MVTKAHAGEQTWWVISGVMCSNLGFCSVHWALFLPLIAASLMYVILVFFRPK